METLILTVFFVFTAGTLVWSIFTNDPTKSDSIIVVFQLWSIFFLIAAYTAGVVDINDTSPIVHKSSVEVCPVVTNTTVITNGDTVNTVEYTYSFPRE